MQLCAVSRSGPIKTRTDSDNVYEYQTYTGFIYGWPAYSRSLLIQLESLNIELCFGCGVCTQILGNKLQHQIGHSTLGYLRAMHQRLRPPLKIWRAIFIVLHFAVLAFVLANNKCARRGLADMRTVALSSSSTIRGLSRYYRYHEVIDVTSRLYTHGCAIPISDFLTFNIHPPKRPSKTA